MPVVARPRRAARTLADGPVVDDAEGEAPTDDVPRAPSRVLANSVPEVVVAIVAAVEDGDTNDWICAIRAEISDRDNGRSTRGSGRVRAPRVLTRLSVAAPTS